MHGDNVEAAVQRIIAQFVQKMLRLARGHVEAELRALSLEARSHVVHPRSAMPRPPAELHTWVHAPDHVDRMVELIRNHPWPPRSSELQALLGVKKDPFLRIAALAVATGRVRRDGYKAGIRYYVVDAATTRPTTRTR